MASSPSLEFIFVLDLVLCDCFNVNKLCKVCLFVCVGYETMDFNSFKICNVYILIMYMQRNLYITYTVGTYIGEHISEHIGAYIGTYRYIYK